MSHEPTFNTIRQCNPMLDLQERGTLAPGLSGASVLLVDFSLDGERRLGVLKTTSKVKAEREIGAYTEAAKTWLAPFLPDYFTILASPADAPEDAALIISLARDRLDNCETLQHAMANSFPYARDSILRSTAYAYGEQATRQWSQAKLQHSREIFRSPFSFGLADGWQEKWRANGLPGSEWPTVVFENRADRWPNPIAWLKNDEYWPNSPSLQCSVPWITSHGDLNSRNVLCPSVNRAVTLGINFAQFNPGSVLEHLSLIDMPFCQEAPFTYDPAFLTSWLTFLLPPFESRAQIDIVLNAYEAALFEISTEQRAVHVPDAAVRFVECASLIFSQMKYAQPRMTSDIKAAFLASLAAAPLWQAIKIGSRDAALSHGQRREALSLFALSALTLKSLLGDEHARTLPLNKRGDFPLSVIEASTSDVGETWTEGASKLGELIASFMGRPNLVLVLGRKWTEACDAEAALGKIAGMSPTELVSLATREPDGQMVRRTASLGRLPLAAVFDWSPLNYPQEQASVELPSSRYFAPVLGGEAAPNWSERNAIFYFCLRGSLKNRSTVAIRPPERNVARVKLRNSVSEFKAHRSSDLTFLYVGMEAKDLQETHAYLFEFWGEKTRYIFAGETSAPEMVDYLAEWNIEPIPVTTEDFLTACADIPAPVLSSSADSARRILVADMTRSEDGELVACPGQILEVAVPTDDEEAIARAGRLLTENDRASLDVVTRDPREFFIGSRIELAEVHQGVPIPRKEFQDRYLEHIREKLTARHLASIIIPSKPGAGGSTMLRCLAHALAFEQNIVTLILNAGGSVAFEAIERIYRLIGRSFAVIADSQDVPTDELQGLKMRCAPSRYPITFVTTIRSLRSESVYDVPVLPLDLQDVAQRGSDGALSVSERVQFLNRLARFCPTVDISKVVNSPARSMFLLTLEAFGDAYLGVNKFVETLLREATEPQRSLLATIAFFSRYTHRNCESEFLEVLSGQSLKEIHNLLEPFDQLLVLSQGESWACRHDQLSKAILQFYLTGAFRDEEYRYALSELFCKQLDSISDPDVGREILSEYVWAVFNPQLEAERGSKGDRPQQSRFIGGEDGLPENAMRYKVFEKASALFDDHVNIISHFGKYLSEREKKWTKADYYLLRAHDLEPKNGAIGHMLGKRYCDELYELLRTHSPRERPTEISEKVDALAATAHEWFAIARERDLSSEFGYTTPIQLNIRLIRDQFQKLGIQSAEDDPTALLIGTVPSLLSEADNLVAEGQRYIEPTNEARRVFVQARDELHQLRGDLSTAIACFQQHVKSQHGISQARAKVQLGRLLVERAERNIRAGENGRASKDFAEGERQLFQVLEDPTQKFKNIKLWFDCARHVAHWRRTDFLERLHQLHEHDPLSLDGAFLLMCLYFCEAVETGSPESWRRYEEFQRKSATRSINLAIRRYAREWLVQFSHIVSGVKTQEYRIFPNYLFDSSAALRERGERRGKSQEDVRQRLRGRIARVDSSTEGRIAIDPIGFEIFFQPRVTDKVFYRSDADRRTEVTFLVQFTYEKPQAFDVERV